MEATTTQSQPDNRAETRRQAPQTPERARAPEAEVPQEVKELQIGASAILHRKIAALVESDKTEGEFTDAEKKLISLKSLGQDYPVGDYTGKPESQCNGNALKVRAQQTNGEMRIGKIVQILSGKENSFICSVEFAGRTPSEGISRQQVEISRTDVVLAKLTAEEAVILQAFEGDEKTVIENYIKYLKTRTKTGEHSLTHDTPEQQEVYSKALEAATKKNGILTTDDLRSYVDHTVPEQKAEEGKQLTMEQQVQNAKRESLLKKLEGKVIVDAKTLVEIIKDQGFDESHIQKDLGELSIQIQNLEHQVNSYSGEARGTLQRKLDACKSKQVLLKTMTEIIRSSEKAEKAFDNLMTGRVDLEKAKNGIHALREGNIDKFLEAVVDIPPEEKDKFNALLKKSGMGSLLLLLLAFWGTGKWIEGFQKGQ